MAVNKFTVISGDNMAANNNTVDLQLILHSTGVEETRKATEATANNLERANKAAAATPKSAALKSVPTTNTSVTDREYGTIGRGTLGTGAAGRDFSKQAQGLGGLVGLYATFAANIFAVGAAYEALNKAAANERLAKATEMMSVEVGVNLKSLSKHLVEAAGSAINFQDAMQFANIGISAGLASSQIESLTKIARGAANALGRDVNDSVRRIIQGTAKQEQEILDELGIFIKAKQAYDKYAKTMGIKVDNLTGRQRVLAYADEVERLGSRWKKYAEIDDPFSRFAATGRNALNEMLIGVNKLFGPLVSYLAESKDGLQAIILLVSTALTKRALPELGNMFSNIFNYDKQVASVKSAEIIKDVQNTRANIAASVAAATAELDALGKKRTLSLNSITGVVGNLGAVTGTKINPGTAGISTTRLSTALLGSETNPKELALLKSKEVVEGRILTILNAQVAAKAEAGGVQDAYIKSLAAQGVIEEGSSAKSLVLSTKSKDIAAEIYAISSAQLSTETKRVALRETLNGLAKEDAHQAEREAKAALITDKAAYTIPRKPIDVVNVSGIRSAVIAASEAEATAATLAHATAVDLETKAVAKGTTAAEMKIATTNNLAISAKLAAEANQNITTAAGAGFSFAGMSASIKQTGIDLKTQYLMMQASTAALGGFSNSADLAAKVQWLLSTSMFAGSAAAKMLGIALTGVMSTLGMLVMPLTIAYTVWSLFGDSIKDWLGITTVASKAMEEQKVKLKEYNETVGLLGESYRTLNKELSTGYSSAEAASKGATLFATALKSQLDAYKSYIAEKDKIDKEVTIKELEAQAAKNHTFFSREVYGLQQLKGLLDTKGGTYANQVNNLKEYTDTLNNALISLSINENAISSEKLPDATVSKLKEKVKTLREEINLLISTDISPTAERTSAAFELQTNAVKQLGDALGKGAEKIGKIYDPLTKLGENGRVIFKNLNTVFEGNTQSTYTYLDSLSLLKGVVDKGGKAAAAAIPVYALLNDILNDPSMKDKNSEGIMVLNLTKVNNKFKEMTTTLAPLLSNLANAASGDHIKSDKVKEYTDAATAGFRALSREVTKATRETELLDISIKNTKTQQATNEGVMGYKTADESASLKALEDKRAEAEYTKEIAKAALDYDKIVKGRTKTASEKEEAFQTFLVIKDSVSLRRDESENANKYSVILDNIKRKVYETNLAYEITKQNLEKTTTAAGYLLTEQQAILEIRKVSGIYTEQELAIMDNYIQAKTIENSLAQQTAAIDEDRKNKLLILYAQEGLSWDTIVTKIVEYNQLSDYQLSTARLKAEQETKILALKHAQTLEQAVLNDQTKQMVDITTSLANVFGDIGTNIGKAGEAILKMAQDEGKYATDRLVAEEKLKLARIQNTGSDDSKKAEVDASVALANLDKKHAKDELTNIATTAGASKKLFSEKTAAYKVLNNVEKVASTYRLAIQLKEDGMKLASFIKDIFFTETKTAAAVAGSATAAGADMAAETLTLPAKLAGAAAKLVSQGGFAGMAAIGVLLALVSSLGGDSSVSANTAGLTSADLHTSQGTGQSWSSGVLVNNGSGTFGDTSAKSTSIVDSLAVMKANSIEGLDYDNKMLSALEKLANSVTTAAKSIYTVPGLRTGTNFGSVDGSSSSGGTGSSIPIIGKLIGNILGGSTTTTSNTVSAGIQLTGSFNSVMNDITGSITQYKDILNQFHEDGGWFSNDKDWSTVTKQTQALKAEVSKSISDIFKDANNLFNELGKKTGTSLAYISAVVSNYDITMPIDIMNLKGQELIDELNAVIGAKLSNVAKTIFTGFEAYKNFGEDYLATVVRVIDANNKVNMSLMSMGDSFSVLQRFDISDAMVKLAGSLTNFIDQSKFFTDNFLTAAEKLAPVQASVIKQLAKLGITTSITKTQFKDLVLAQDLATEAGRSMYQSLMDLAPGFNTVMDGIKTSMQDTISTITDSISKFKDFAKTLINFKESLLLSNSSTATPTEKYAEAKSQFESVYALAMGGDADAISKLTSISQSFLDTSKTLYASSDQYTTDFNYILGKLDTGIVATNVAQTIAEKQLAAANAQTELLTIIKDSTAVTAAESTNALQKIFGGAPGEPGTLVAPREVTSGDKLVSQVVSSISGNSGLQSAMLTGWSSMTQQERAAYYNDNPTIGAMTTALQDSFGYLTTIGAIIKMVDPVSWQSNLDTASGWADPGTQPSGAVTSAVTQGSVVTTALGDTVGAAAAVAAGLAAATEAAAAATAAADAATAGLNSAANESTDSSNTSNTTNTESHAWGSYGGYTTGGGEYAKGGLASSGVNLVGEEGAELVDFKTPGRVYTASQTRDLLGSRGGVGDGIGYLVRGMLDEMQQLRKELSQLRKDQQKQTGDIIISNYDANQKVSDDIANAIVNTSSDSAWATRSMSVIV